MKNTLTIKQQKVLDFIETYIDSNNDSPTLFEIQKFLGVKALSTVHQYIKSLEQKGYLQKDANAARGINYIMNAGRYIGQFIRIPMVGTIVAGYPLEAVEEISEYLTFPSSSFSETKEYFALKVKGDSMVDSYIMEDDLVIVEKTHLVSDGDLVVALVDGGNATLKHFFKHADNQIRLQPANQKYKPFIYPVGEVEIQGKVVQIIRKY